MELRESGIAAVGGVPWGTHHCQFYKTRTDLLETIVPYLKAGLESREYCLWLAYEPLVGEVALSCLKSSISGVDRYLRKQNLEIIPIKDLLKEGETFEAKKVIQSWDEKLMAAQERGLVGMRVLGDQSWQDPSNWSAFSRLERDLNCSLATRRMIIMCAYPVEKCGADAILDVAGAHQCVIAIREGHWDILESPQLQRTKAELSRVNKELEKRVIESERYVESLTRNKRLRRQFVSALTHDVRNPLAAALMNAQLLARKLPGNFQVQSLTKRIVLALQRADGLIQDLLDLNKILSNAQIPFEIEEFDLYEVLDRLVKRIAPLQSRQIVLSSTRELIGHWDRRTLTQALDILISCSSSQADSGVPIFIEVQAGQSVSVDLHFKGTAPWISDSERWLLLSTHVEGIIRQHGGVFKADLMPTQEVRFHLEFPVRAGLSEISHAA